MPRKIKKTAAEPVRLTVRLAKGDGFVVDREAGTIFGVSVITRGPAIGHGFDVDDVMLRQVAVGINGAKGGLKAHFDHPQPWMVGGDGIYSRLGRWKNARIEETDGEAKVRADFAFGDYAENLPGLGNVRDYLLGIIEDGPEDLGVSILYDPDEDEQRQDGKGQTMAPAGRIKRLRAADFVEDPAANPGGLLSRGEGEAGQPGDPDEEKEDSLMDPKARKYLVGLGLKADATDEEALKFQKGLTDEQKTEMQRLTAPPKPAEPDKSAEDAAAKAGREAAEKTLKAEGDRIKGIKALAGENGLDDAWALRHIEAGTDLRSATLASAELKKFRDQKPVSIRVVADLARGTLAEAISDAVLLRAGRPIYTMGDPATGGVVCDENGRPKRREPVAQAVQFRHLRMTEMARRFLAILGEPGTDGMSERQVWHLALRSNRIALAQGTGDFPYILQDAANKSLQAAYVEMTPTWPIWARRATASDFKTINRAALSESPDLVETAEGGPVKYLTLGEKRETYVLGRYIAGIRLTYKARVNDDLDAFSRIPTLQAAAARRKEEDVVYAILTANAVLGEDGKALFHADHANVLSSAGTAAKQWFLAADPTQIDTVEVCFLSDEPIPQLTSEIDFDTDDIKYKVTHAVAAKAIDYRGLVRARNSDITVATLGSCQTLMRLQKGLSSAAILNLTPRYLIVPAAKEVEAFQIINSVVDPTKSNATVNPFANRLTIVVNARLDAATI